MLSETSETPVSMSPRKVWTVARRSAVRASHGQLAVLVLVLILIAAFAQSRSSVFLHWSNIVDILRASVTTFVIGAAATIVFVGGGLDLSVGAVFSFGAVVAGELMVHGWSWPLAVVTGLAGGAAVGLVNSGLVLLARVPPIIATLSTLYAVGGIALVLTNGTPLAPLPADFNALGQNSAGGLPLLIIYALAIGVLFHVLLRFTRFGYDVQALGGNARAALANGVRVNRVTTMVYVVSGVMAALAGILYTARTGTADPQAGGADVTLAVIAATLIGGTSLFGGVGTILGTAFGAVLFAEITDALTVANINPLYQDIILGGILAAAVAADSWRRARAFKTGSGYR